MYDWNEILRTGSGLPFVGIIRRLGFQQLQLKIEKKSENKIENI